MNEIKGRGYILAATVGFLRETAGKDRAQEILASVSPALQEVVRTVKPAEFYSVRLFGELNRTLVTHLAGSDDDRAREVLIACGRHMGREASNTFLKLLMKMLTPALIVKKIPDFWKRDFTGGRVEIHATESRLVCSIFDMQGHDHLLPISAGWQAFNLEQMGKSLEEIVLRNWSLTDPSKSGASFELIWKT